MLDDAHLSLSYDNISNVFKRCNNGNGLALLLRSGRAIASWSHHFEGNRVQVKVASFDGEKLQFGVDAGAFDGVGELLGASSVEVDGG